MICGLTAIGFCRSVKIVQPKRYYSLVDSKTVRIRDKHASSTSPKNKITGIIFKLYYCSVCLNLDGRIVFSVYAAKTLYVYAYIQSLTPIFVWHRI